MQLVKRINNETDYKAEYIGEFSNLHIIKVIADDKEFYMNLTKEDLDKSPAELIEVYKW